MEDKGSGGATTRLSLLIHAQIKLMLKSKVHHILFDLLYQSQFKASIKDQPNWMWLQASYIFSNFTPL